MTGFLILVPFVVIAGLLQIVYGLGGWRRRWRRLVAGSVLLLLLLPAWMLIGGAVVSRRTSVLLLFPNGEAVPAGTPLKGDGGKPVYFATAGLGDATAAGPLDVKWTRGLPPATAVRPPASIYDDWDRVSAAAVMPWQEWLRGPFLPKPVVVIVDGGSNTLDTVRAQEISVSDVSSALKRRGVTLYRLKADADGVGGGRLELTVSGNSRARSLKSLSTRIDVSLSGCPFPGSGYRLRAWLDRRAGKGGGAIATFEDQEDRPAGRDKNKDKNEVVVGDRETDRRTTALSLYRLEPADVALSTGLHEVSVELSFRAVIEGVEALLIYRSSTFIEVEERRLVVFSAASSVADLFRQSWVHRDMPKDGELPPSSAGKLAKQFLEDDDASRLFNTGNGTRTPFTAVDVVTQRADMTPSRLDGAAEVVLVEPTWDDLIKLSDVVEAYAKQSGSVLVVRPPVRPKTDTTTELKWLPAVSDDARPLARGDPRIYLLPDASRPASFIGTPSALNSTGDLLQQKVFNRLASRLAPRSALGETLPGGLLDVGGKHRLSLNGAVGGVLRTDRDGGWSVVPPTFMRTSETTVKTSEAYTAGTNMGGQRDLVASWVEARVGLLESAQRGVWYGKPALQGMFAPPAAPSVLAELTSRDLDLPLEQDTQFPSTVLVVAALDVPQAQKRPDGVTATVWTRAGQSQDEKELPNFFNVTELVKGGAEVVLVPIQLDAGFLGAGGPYGDALVNSLKDSLGVYKDLAALSAATGAYRTNALALDASDKQIDDVVDQIVKRLDSSVGARRRLVLSQKSAARAVDLRAVASFPVTFAYQPLALTKAAKGIEPAARVEWPPAGGATATPVRDNVLVVMPFEQGVVSVIGFNPFSFDRWYADRAYASMTGAGDGWGLQRLIDPVVRMSGNIGSGGVIESVIAAADRSQLRVTCRLPVGDTAAPFDLPRLASIVPAGSVTGSAPAGRPTVTILGFDPLSGRMDLSIAAENENAVDGEYRLTFQPEGVSTDGGTRLFVAVKGQGDPAGGVRERLDRIAYQTGGSAVDLAQFGKVLSSATFDGRFVGSGLLVLLTMVLLSPLSRAWHSPAALAASLARWGRRRAQADTDVDDEAEAYAAIDAGGMSRGAPAAQRPAGPVVQLRQMRPGDSAAAVPPNHWILFVPDLADAIGSPPLPRVYETPKPQAMSILTLLDLHAGAAVHDVSAATDRLRVMTRIAMMNAIASGRRGGTHRVAALQVREDPESTEASMPDQVPARIAALRRGIGAPPVVPELLENELVILISDPASLTRDEVLRQLARDCGENLCSLSALMLVHPNQLTEFGNRSAGSATGLFDRADLDSGLVARFHAERTEQVAAALGIVDSRTIPISSSLSTDALAKVLAEEAWTHA
jgi:hypothetical protein